MKLAKGTSPWLAAPWLCAAAFAALALATTPLWWLAAAPALAVALLLLNFFRDPERTPGDGVVAPADGVVTAVEQLPDGGTRVNTFMNPLDVHVNRAPLAGRVLEVRHVPGGFIPAFRKESERNERVEWAFETEAGTVRMVQIAGTLARRIIPYSAPGEKVNKAERIGIIRLGSRVDLYLPPGPVVVVRVGDKVRAGETTVARWR